MVDRWRCWCRLKWSWRRYSVLGWVARVGSHGTDTKRLVFVIHPADVQWCLISYIGYHVFVPRVFSGQFGYEFIRTLILFAIIYECLCFWSITPSRSVMNHSHNHIPRKWRPASGCFSAKSFRKGQVAFSQSAASDPALPNLSIQSVHNKKYNVPCVVTWKTYGM